MSKVFGSLVALFLMLSGCAHVVSPIPLSQAIDAVQGDVVKTKALSISNFSTWTAGQRYAFEFAVFNNQCYQNKNDPLVPIISGPLNLGLTGMFTTSGNFQVSNTLTAPAVSFGGSATHQQGQTIAVPVEFVALSSVPEVEAARSVSRAGALLAQNDDVRHNVGSRIIAEKEVYSEYIIGLIQGFDVSKCPTYPKGWDTTSPVFMGAHLNR